MALAARQLGRWAYSTGTTFFVERLRAYTPDSTRPHALRVHLSGELGHLSLCLGLFIICFGFMHRKILQDPVPRPARADPSHPGWPPSTMTIQNLAVRRIAEASADTELEVNAVCPGNCLTPINPTGKDTTRLCTETILWLALGRRGSSPGRRVHGGFFRYMKQVSFENGRHLMDVVPDDSMRSWWDKIESGSEH